MNDATAASTPDPSPRLTFNINPPFAVLPDAAPANFLVKGLVKSGTCVSLSAKAKQGKSSLSRYLATCVSKGSSFLGRDTEKGEVLIISIEDGNSHIDSCLKALKWDSTTDSAIRLVTDVTGSTADKMTRLRHALEDYPGTRLVTVDTLAKFARVKDVNCYDDWLELFDPLRRMLKDFPKVSVVFTVHAKKATSEDVFDAMHGSVAIRAEFESNFAIFSEGGKRFFAAETRIGKPIEPTELTAQMIEIDGADVVADFSLGATRDSLEHDVESKKARKTGKAYEDKIIEVLSNQHGDSIVYRFLCDEVTGKKANVLAALDNLIQQGVVVTTGAKGSVTDPYTLRLDRNSLKIRDFQYKFPGDGELQYEGEQIQ